MTSVGLKRKSAQKFIYSRESIELSNPLLMGDIALPSGKDLVYLIRLDDEGAPILNGKYIRLSAPYEPYTLRFEVDQTSTIANNLRFKTNCVSRSADFVRDHYEVIQPRNTKAKVQIDLDINLAGAFSWFIEYSNGDGSEGKTPIYYFAVEPALRINGEPTPLPSLALQSVVSKWMGPVTEWEPRLKYISTTKKYNMVHFTPLQQRGSSNSSYSIYDQNVFADDLFDDAQSLNANERTKKIGDVVETMEKDHNLLSLTDIVLNHTANDSDWLLDHPDAGYNLENSPHLCAAYELDTALLDFGDKLGRYGLPTELRSLQDLFRLMEGIKSRVLSTIKLWEFYIIDRDQALSDFKAKTEIGEHLDIGGISKHSSLSDKADKALVLGLVSNHKYLGDRYHKRIDVAKFNDFVSQLVDDENDAEHAAGLLIDEINLRFHKEFDADQESMLDQVYNRIKYMRLDDHGPKLGAITEESPLIESYFMRLPENDRTAKHSKHALKLACNGWLWGANPLEDFAGPRHKSYLIREVIIWQDCVKLRFGDKPADSPFLWKHMTTYTQTLASIFHGFRIDNCHSTPIPVASYLLDEARKIRPDLYVVAELFTGSDEIDTIFTQKLGLSSLIREGMQVNDARELSRLVHMYGGKPIGSIEESTVLAKGAPVPVTSSKLNALFMDCTHDNETPNQKRCAEDTLPSAGIVAMSSAAIGSVMGYDEIYPHILDIVSEDRHYSSETNGIGHVRGLLNDIHAKMGRQSYSECHVHYENEYITVHRVNPITQHGYYLIAHTAFQKHEERGQVSAMRLGGTAVKCLFSGCLDIQSRDDPSTSEILAGLPAVIKEIQEPHVHYDHGDSNITVPDYFPAGSIALFETHSPAFVDSGIEDHIKEGAMEAVQSLSLIDLNVLLYRCDAEEQDTIHDGAYELGNCGKLVYCGLQGWIAPIKDVIKSNELGHALCENLRQGQWAFDYILNRLRKYIKLGHYERLSSVVDWLESKFGLIRGKIPNFLLPRYFIATIYTLYTAARSRAIRLFSETIQKDSNFTQSLALCSIQMQGQVASASLSPSTPQPCMAAGLPHFSTSWARCWGRDIFIAIRGLFLVTGRFEEAEQHILAFATTLKHGMIPNLLDSIKTPRYNSRDSIWFYMQSIQDYVNMVPSGAEILSKKVKRRFPLDDKYVEWDSPEAYAYESSVEEVIQETLQRHASGLHFREANAGPNLDMQMSDDGFNIDIEVDWSNGLIFGGSQKNCGTWMDKMGESEKAGSKGVPGTPRDGAAIEITGLLKSTLRWVIELHEKKLYKHDSVEISQDGTTKKVTFKEWNDLIQSNFERCYFIPISPEEDSNYDVDSKIIHRRGIYKDLYKSGKPYEDYQLRAQVPIAMVVAPELFNIENALSHLKMADTLLRGPLGIATLDPGDANYRGEYNNSEDSHDFHTAKGRNYHQGPEWVFPMGYFLRAWLGFNLRDGRERDEVVREVHARLGPHRREIENSAWAGLTELTNAHGQICNDSSPTQAWSAGTLLDLLDDIRKLE